MIGIILSAFNVLSGMGSFLNIFSDLNFSRHKLTAIILCIALFLIVPSNSKPVNLEPNSCDTATQFQCSGKFVCIPIEYMCDGDIDCIDGSDEETCPEGVKRRNGTVKINHRPLYEFESYAKSLTDPINKTSIEFFIDYKEGEKDIVAMHKDFNPDKIMRALTERAASTVTPPNQFHWEIRQLISPEKGFDQTYYEELLEKYQIRPKAEDPDSATLFRLRMMFPHYCNMGHKPFFSSPRIHVIDRFEAPAMLQHAEFAGLIPRFDTALPYTSYSNFGSKYSKQTLIALHLYLLSRNGEETVPLRIRCLTLKERIEKSVLSDDRRIRLLQNNHILTASKTISTTNIPCKPPLNPNYSSYYEIYSCIPEEFHNGCTPYL